MPSERTSYEDAAESRLCRCYRVSRSYLHLNRGLTSPLATAMNFIPVSYFCSPLWWLRDVARCPPPAPPSLLSIISVAAVARHLGAVFRTFAAILLREEAKKRTTTTSPSLAQISPTSFPSPFSGPLKQEFRKRPRGREIREGYASRRRGSFREKMQSATAILPLYLGISRFKHRAIRNLVGRTEHTATFPAFSIFVVVSFHSYE